VVSRSVHRALNGLAPVIYDQGRQTRSFTYVADAVEGTVRAAASPLATGQAFNIGNMHETTVAEAVAAIAALTGFDAPTLPVDTATTLGSSYQDLPRRVPDATKARTMLGWSAGTSLPDGLAKTVEWARANPWWLAIPDTGAR
jgi:UDP-glucose 4-epimerase